MLLGAYGWVHNSWNGAFYPEDLPQDWQLTYYSNEFNAVLVPVNIWSEDIVSVSEAPLACEEWLDAVSDKFQFYIECRADMFADISFQSLSKSLKVLQPQLSGLVVVDEGFIADSMKVFSDLATMLEAPLFVMDISKKDSKTKYFCQTQNGLSNFMLLESDLLDLRATRKQVEDFVARSVSGDSDLSSDSEQTTIIVNHPVLSANDLIRFRGVVEIMGL